MNDKLNIYELVYLAKGQDETAFLKLYEMMKPFIYKSFMSIKNKQYLIDEADMESAAMLGLYSAISHYRDDRNTAFTSFATLCIMREMQNASRCKTRNMAGLSSWQIVSLDQCFMDGDSLNYGDVVLKDLYHDPQQSFRAQVVLEEIDKILTCPNEKKIVHMRSQGYTYQEIADQLGMKRKTVDNTIQRIRKKIFYLFD